MQRPIIITQPSCFCQLEPPPKANPGPRPTENAMALRDSTSSGVIEECARRQCGVEHQELRVLFSARPRKCTSSAGSSVAIIIIVAVVSLTGTA